MPYVSGAREGALVKWCLLMHCMITRVSQDQMVFGLLDYKAPALKTRLRSRRLRNSRKAAAFKMGLRFFRARIHVYLGFSCSVFGRYCGAVSINCIRPYAVTRSVVRADRDVDVVIEGPGMSSQGTRYVLSTMERGRMFVDALNMAYESGFVAGLEQARQQAKLHHRNDSAA